VASYTIQAGELAAWGKTLTAATVDTVTFAGTDNQADKTAVRVWNDTGAVAIFFTLDGTDPTVAGAKTYRVPAVAGACTEVVPLGATATTVKLISSGTPTYSVEGA
jgi:hypothetical protein